jgi:molecular chaperone GrpE
MAEENTKKIEEKEKSETEEEDELTKCQKERDEYLDGWKRAKADLINYKKDEAKRFEAVVKFANEAIIRDLINVLDSFDLALIALTNADITQTNAEINKSQTNADDTQTNTEESPRESASWQKGLYLIRQQLEDILRQNGLERIIVSVGQPFDPALQEAIATVESDKPGGTVVEEVEKGYLLNGKLIRPARVKVAK